MANIARDEAGLIAQKSVTLLVARMNPFISTESYNKYLRELMDSMDWQSFKSYVPELLKMLKLTKSNSKKFSQSSREVDDLLRQLPKLEGYRQEVLDKVRLHRDNCNLPC
jgi:hypothetical protein